jgi:hypothetical protein
VSRLVAQGEPTNSGRERFLREMTADGISPAAAVGIIERAESRLASEELNRALADLAGRVGT